MNILVVSNNYPSLKHPTRGVFVYNLIQEFSKLGHNVTVIAPESFSISKPSISDTYGNENCTVFRPKFLSFSSKQLFFFNTYRLTEWSQIKAIRNVVQKNQLNFDVVYCHFMMNGISAINALNAYNKPVFVAIGESDLMSFVKRYSKAYFNKSLKKIKGFIAVSNKLKDQLIELGVDSDRILMKPNAVNLNNFYQRDKQEMRRKHGFPLDKKLVAFVGRFMEHKGPLRVLEAVEEINNVGILFVGSGPQNPEGNSVVFKDSVPSTKIPEILSAADLFVLPTQKEGSCNAIAEAIACGLPIVSSNIPEVIDQCDDSFSILVNPTDVDALKLAINTIIDDDMLANKMANNALSAAKKFEIGERSSKILQFIEKQMTQ